MPRRPLFIGSRKISIKSCILQQLTFIIRESLAGLLKYRRISMATEFKGMLAVVTGSGSGIGLATARLLKSRGAAIFGLDLQQGELGDVGTWVSCDVSDRASVSAAFEVIQSHVDRIDIVVNNAGIGAIGTILDATDEEWDNVYRVNVVGTALVSAAALPLLLKSENASIVNLCSIAATVGLPSRAVYSASKGAVLSLTLAMAADFVGDNIRVNCVNPGTADTPWIRRLLSKASEPAAELEALNLRQPIRRLITAEEVAQSVCYLASPLQASTTGTILAVDGGFDTLRLRR
jgi:2-keto-3-deoxy-L-fuconate dehydrogenase